MARYRTLHTPGISSSNSTSSSPIGQQQVHVEIIFFLDTMHIMDCKGMASTIFGSVVWMLVRDARLGQNQQQRLDLINERLRRFYSRNPGVHKLPKITLQSIIGSNGWAELCGPAIKAAGTRELRHPSSQSFVGSSSTAIQMRIGM